MRKKVVVAVTVSIGIVAGLVGLNYYSNEEVPDPENTGWNRISVQYCVGEAGSKVALKTWVTEDRGLLREMQDSFVVSRKTGLTVIGAMRTNRIDLKLSDNKEVVMYLYEECLASYYNKDNIQQSFALDIDKGFLEKLKKTIKEVTGDQAYFYYDREVEIRKE